MRHGSLLCFLGLLAGSLTAAPLPGGFDHSGWYEFEVIILVNSQAEVLQSETWPLLPQPAYPSRWRWLQERSPSSEGLSGQQGTRIHHSLSGHTMIYEPEPRPAPWLPSGTIVTEGDLASIDELIELAKGSTSTDRKVSLSKDDPASPEQTGVLNPDPILPFEAAKPVTPSAPLLSLEALVLDGTGDNLAQDISVPFAPSEQHTELRAVNVEAASIPVPATFERLPLTTLAPGLERYRASSSDEIIAATAWLQGPGSENLPILIEPENTDGYPLAQGFIQVVPTGSSWRLGLNIWANTHGQYLPDIFEMDPPPASPPRTTRVTGRLAELPQTPGALDNAHPTPLSNAIIKSEQSGGESPDQMPGETGPPDASASSGGIAVDGAAPLPPEWRWRHVIHVADTVPLAENRLRYYDHPVIKVLAIWRELSWYELYQRGAMLRDAKPPVTSD